MFTDACMHMAGYNGSRILVDIELTNEQMYNIDYMNGLFQ